MAFEPITKPGFMKLNAELSDLRGRQINEVNEEIATAREYGDLKENAEYHAAKEKKAKLEAKISTLQDYLSRAEIVAIEDLAHDKISFGSSFKIMDLDSEEELEFSVVGLMESSIEKRLISYHSPLVKALLGKVEGDEVSVIMPNGEKDYEVLEISFKPLDDLI